MPKQRLDLVLVEKGMVESRSLAQRLVMAGQVRVAGEVMLKPSTIVDSKVEVTIEKGLKFVSRGGEKLEAALEAFALDVKDAICADVGSSTGGFCDCLLQRGAKRIYAIDVGKGILHWKLRQRQEIIVMEQTNARFVERLPELIQFISIDASFISLKTLLPVVKGWMFENGDVVALIKPQFEAGRKEVAKGDGVIRDPEVHRRVLIEILDFTQSIGFSIQGLIRSPLQGPKGNVEFLVWLHNGGGSLDTIQLVTSAMIKLP